MPHKDPEARRRWQAEWRARNREAINANLREWRKTPKGVALTKKHNDLAAAARGETYRPRTPHQASSEAFRADLTDPRHGTTNGYSNLKCRCEGCRGAWAKTMRDYKERRKNL